MSSDPSVAYEATRRRHQSYFLGLLPGYLTRLQWSREQIEAEQTRALRELVRHAVDYSPWHRDRLRHLDIERLTPAAGGAFCCPIDPGCHISEDVNIIEPVDGRGNAVPRGERSAKILLTNFYNRIMPLIRYEITDEFELAATPCSCGSAYVKVADVHGRADDVFSYAAGVKVHPLNFRTVLGKDPAIVEYQVRQTADGAAVDVVATPGLDIVAIRSALEERLTTLRLGVPRVIVRRVHAIGREATGKLKRFVSLPHAG